eukprot:g10983.t1
MKEAKRKDNSGVIMRDVGNHERKKASIKALYLNARSIRNKVDELMAQIIANEYDLVAITETWLQDGHDWELNIQGYRLFGRTDRK